MLITRYKSLVALPGIPAGELFEKRSGDRCYRAKAASYWADEPVIENDPATFVLHEIVRTDGVVSTQVFSAGVDVVLRAQQSIADKIDALRVDIATADVAGAKL